MQSTRRWPNFEMLSITLVLFTLGILQGSTNDQFDDEYDELKTDENVDYRSLGSVGPIFGNEHEGLQPDEVPESEQVDESYPPSIMDTYEKFKRQAERVSVPGDEARSSNEYGHVKLGLGDGLSWQSATIMSVLCVGAALIGVIFGVMYWPKKSFGDGDRDESMISCSSQSGIGTSKGENARTDRSLAHSAQMYHYQQQKQQMLAMDDASGKRHILQSDNESEAGCEEPDTNVYECPGLSTAGESDVANPLFQENLSTGSQTPPKK